MFVNNAYADGTSLGMTALSLAGQTVAAETAACAFVIMGCARCLFCCSETFIHLLRKFAHREGP